MRNSENTRWRCLGRCSNTWRRLPVDAGTLSLLTTNCRNIILYDCVCLYPSPPEEYRALNKSSHFISFFGHFGWVSPWLEPRSCLLLWLVLQVSFEQPLFLLLSGVHEKAIFACLVLSILNACPNHFHHLHLMTMLIFSISVLYLTSSFVTLCGQ